MRRNPAKVVRHKKFDHGGRYVTVGQDGPVIWVDFIGPHGEEFSGERTYASTAHASKVYRNLTSLSKAGSWASRVKNDGVFQRNPRKAREARFVYAKSDGSLTMGTHRQIQSWKKMSTKRRVKKTKRLSPGQCCQRARVDRSAGSAYAYAWKCPVHGRRRVGSSD